MSVILRNDLNLLVVVNAFSSDTSPRPYAMPKNIRIFYYNNMDIYIYIYTVYQA